MEWLDKVLEILQTPIVLGGLGTFTIGSVVVMIIKALIGAKKSDIANLTTQVNNLSTNQSNYTEKAELQQAYKIIKKSNDLQKKLIATIKNENVKQQLELERQEIESELPSEEEVVEQVVEQVVEETKARF